MKESIDKMKSDRVNLMNEVKLLGDIYIDENSKYQESLSLIGFGIEPNVLNFIRRQVKGYREAIDAIEDRILYHTKLNLKGK